MRSLSVHPILGKSDGVDSWRIHRLRLAERGIVISLVFTGLLFCGCSPASVKDTSDLFSESQWDAVAPKKTLTQAQASGCRRGFLMTQLAEAFASTGREDVRAELLQSHEREALAEVYHSSDPPLEFSSREPPNLIVSLHQRHDGYYEMRVISKEANSNLNFVFLLERSFNRD